MRLLFHLLFVPLFIFACALAAIWLPLPPPFPPALSQSRNLIAALVAGLILPGNLLWLAFYIVNARLQHSRAVDRPLTSLGLKAQAYLLFGRRYQGDIRGRRVNITFVRGRWGDSALNITVQADIDTRAAIGQKRPLLDCRACPRLTVSAPDLNHPAIYAQDEAWMQNLLTQSAVREALKRLMDGRTLPGRREIYLQPGRVWFYAHPQDIAAAPFEAWLDDLMTLAGAAESSAQPDNG